MVTNSYNMIFNGPSYRHMYKRNSIFTQDMLTRKNTN